MNPPKADDANKSVTVTVRIIGEDPDEATADIVYAATNPHDSPPIFHHEITLDAALGIGDVLRYLATGAAQDWHEENPGAESCKHHPS